MYTFYYKELPLYDGGRKSYTLLTANKDHAKSQGLKQLNKRIKDLNLTPIGHYWFWEDNTTNFIVLLDEACPDYDYTNAKYINVFKNKEDEE